MTEKLYYKDAYIKEFDATVLSCEADGGSYYVVLDKTAFFPEEGGQTADTGKLGHANVLDVREQFGIIYHKVDKALEAGKSVHGILDFDERFSKMQCHSAEHILSGYFKSIYGLDNVGFHLGSTDVTMDINGTLTREELDRVETLANEAVFENLPVLTYFPSNDELSALEYRSKLELTENVRIVKIGDIDTCACCAPHVRSTGEIGMIKMLDFEKHKGGLRIHMVAGSRLLSDYRDKYSNVAKISALLCEPQITVCDAVDRLKSFSARLEMSLKALKLRIAVSEAEKIEKTEGNAIYLYPDMSYDELREFCNTACHKVGGVLLALSGSEGEYKYTICTASEEISSIVKDMNKALFGRGGGRGTMAQGTLYTTLEEIKRYFKL